MPESGAIEGYRRIVATAIYPDPFSHRPVSVREANTAIAEYRRATGDVAGAVDLMLTTWVGGRFDPHAFNPRQVRFDEPHERWKTASCTNAAAGQDDVLGAAALPRPSRFEL